MPSKTNQNTFCVYVSNLPNATSEAELQALFSKHAAVQRVQMFSGRPYRRSQGFGYLDLCSNEADGVVSALDGKVFNGSILSVSLLSWAGPAPQPAGDGPAGEEKLRGDEKRSSLLRPRYEVASVDKAAMPTRGQGNDWYRYVLLSGEARITGFHRGTLDEVTAYASSCADDINLRAATGKSARTLASLAYRKKK